MSGGYSFTLAILLVLLLVRVPCPARSDDDLIIKTCKKTPHVDLCVSSLKSDSGSSTSDVKGLATIVANLTLKDAATTRAKIQQLIKDAEDLQLLRSLSYCGEAYIEVVQEDLPQAIGALAKGNFGFAKYGVSYASKQVNSCEKKFSGAIKSPIADDNQLLHDLSDITGAILILLVKAIPN